MSEGFWLGSEEFRPGEPPSNDFVPGRVVRWVRPAEAVGKPGGVVNAAYYARWENLQRLLEAGADVCEQDSNGNNQPPVGTAHYGGWQVAPRSTTLLTMAIWTQLPDALQPVPT